MVEVGEQSRMRRPPSDRLENSSDTISIIAPSLGSESEAAFSAAFKKVMGCSPRHYGRGRTSNSPVPADIGRLRAAAGR